MTPEKSGKSTERTDLTLSMRSNPSGGADLRISRGLGGNTRFGSTATLPHQGQ
jgi:hypothetical protein